MQSLLVIFNGIQFHAYLMNKVLVRAKVHGASVHAFFLRTKDENSEGYAFPSDLDAAESLTNSEDALQDDEKIIGHQIRLASTMADLEEVPFTWEALIDCRLNQIVKMVTGFDVIFLDVCFDDGTPAMLTSDRFTSKELIDAVSVPVEIVRDE